MQNAEMTLRIEMFGNLLMELKHWHLCLDNEEGSDETFEYLENRYEEVLDAVREFKELLLVDLNEYVSNCKENDIPIDISYYRIRKEVSEIDI